MAFTRFAILLLAWFGLLGPLGAADPATVEFFEKRIRPVLVEQCVSCHGPQKQRAHLRVDSLSALLKGGDRGPAVVPGKPDASPLIAAIRYTDDTFQMPPRSKLKDEQITDFVAWVRSGAHGPMEAVASRTDAKKEFDFFERRRHWCYRAFLRHVQIPVVQNANWPATPIDSFILQRLETAGLQPAPPVDPRTWLRRVTYDLIGLPPTPAEADAFLADSSPTARARVVDRLLASPHYGERWGRHWLDLVRYAETLGHEFDNDIHHAWRYRDYVIRAFNDDLPYDQFVLEHLAGDLLPNPRRHPRDGFNESIIATGFFWLGEGKHAPVDVRQEQADRIDNQIDVFGKTFLAQTLACARCHDHKFDAIATADYYALYGCLKSSRYQQAFLDPPERIQARVRQLEAVRQEMRQEVLRQIRAQLQTLPLDPVGDKGTSSLSPAGYEAVPLVNWFETGDAFGNGLTAPGEIQVASQPERGSIRFLTPGIVHSGRLSPRLEGVLRSATFQLDHDFVHVRAAGAKGRINLIVDGFQQIANPIYGGLTLPVDRAEPGWLKIDVRMWRGHRAWLELHDSTTPNMGQGLSQSTDVPSSHWLRVDAIWLSNAAEPPSTTTPTLSDRDQILSSLSRWEAGFRVTEPADVATTVRLNALLDQQRLKVTLPADLVRRWRAIEDAIPAPLRAPAMCDGTGENEVVFVRGNYRTPGPIVARGFPRLLHGMPKEVNFRGSGRLELARQFINPTNPLPVLVFVNRIWKQHFGEGLVRSTDDFGVMGDKPSHPELLDWLAADFYVHGYSVKHLHRCLVLSSTYAQASRRTPQGDQVDPGNHLLHRMPLRRLEAEAIRDALVAVSGRLEERLYGPSVPPYLNAFMEGRGRPGASGPLDGAGRRSIYLNVRRNFLNPMFLAFDYPVPFSTMGRRSISNVPAQALSLLNDPFVLQQTRRWAERLRTEFPDPTARLQRLYVEAFGRPCTATEANDAREFLAAQAQERGGQATEVDLWADLCHVLANVKEFVYIP